jgi:predicted metal-dependent phosphoesterase TrpH
VLKIELHAHTSDDPQDDIPYSTRELIAHVAARGYQALAITLHDRQLDLADVLAYAQSLGVTLIPGIERTIEGKHVLLLNFPAGLAEAVRSFGDLRRLRAQSTGLVVAPHPFFPASSCLRSLMDRHRDLFDAVEITGMFTGFVNLTLTPARWAREAGLPLVGNGDVHRLDQVGTTWSLVDAEPDPDSICRAIRAGRVRVEAHPHSTQKAAAIMSDLFIADARQGLASLVQPRTTPSASTR